MTSIPQAMTNIGIISGSDIANGASTFYPSVATGNNDREVRSSIMVLLDPALMLLSSLDPVFLWWHLPWSVHQVYQSRSRVTKPSMNLSTVFPTNKATLECWTGLVWPTQPNKDNCFWAFKTITRGIDPIEWHPWERGASAVHWEKVCVQQH
jgi:hypothetical protein